MYVRSVMTSGLSASEGAGWETVYVVQNGECETMRCWSFRFISVPLHAYNIMLRPHSDKPVMIVSKSWNRASMLMELGITFTVVIIKDALGSRT